MKGNRAVEPQMPKDPSVVQNYGSLLEQLVQTVPDGLVPTPESEAINY